VWRHWQVLCIVSELLLIVGIGKAILIVVAKFGQVLFQGMLMNWKLGCDFFPLLLSET